MRIAATARKLEPDGAHAGARRMAAFIRITRHVRIIAAMAIERVRAVTRQGRRF